MFYNLYWHFHINFNRLNELPKICVPDHSHHNPAGILHICRMHSFFCIYLSHSHRNTNCWTLFLLWKHMGIIKYCSTANMPAFYDHYKPSISCMLCLSQFSTGARQNNKSSIYSACLLWSQVGTHLIYHSSHTQFYYWFWKRTYFSTKRNH